MMHTHPQPLLIHFSLGPAVVHIPNLSSSSLAQECTHIIRADAENGLQNGDVALKDLGAARHPGNRLIQDLHPADEGTEAAQKGVPLLGCHAVIFTETPMM